MKATSKRTPALIRAEGNHLQGEGSLYLEQHAHNPIDWYPWTEEALERSRSGNKPIFLSVGYSSCHWCHVMEREVFEHDDVAEFMNEHFICIKVDREEMPDIDATYMEAVMALNGSGGWPMSVFLTPDLKPFYGGTYYPHDSFLALAEALARAHVEKPDVIAEQADKLHEFISRNPELSGNDPVAQEWIDTTARRLVQSHDPRWGGLDGKMKFPTPLVWTFLLHHYRRTGDEQTSLAVRKTLDGMASGGIHDHLSGGFHRYTVEGSWLIPHFEKMLYDNALLAMLYTESAAVFKSDLYEEVARSTLDFMIDTMSDSGGFFSSLDADSGGVEGSYYVWTPDEIRKVVGEKDAAALSLLFGVTDRGNFEGSNILTRRVPTREVATSTNMDPDDVEGLVDRWRGRLLEERSKRTAPGLDRKIITSWNGLAIAAMARGYRTLGQDCYRIAARGAADFLWTHHRAEDGTLLRASNQGTPSAEGILDDHAFLAWGLTELFLATGDSRQLRRAVQLVETAVALFAHPEAGFYHSARDQEGLPRQIHVSDNARPSGNATMLQVLIMLGGLTGREDFRETAGRTLAGYSELMKQSPADMAWWWDAAQKSSTGILDVIIAGDPSHRATQALLDRFARISPSHAVITVIPADGASGQLARLLPPTQGKKALEDLPTAFVCRHGSCNEPTHDPDVMQTQILAGWHR